MPIRPGWVRWVPSVGLGRWKTVERLADGVRVSLGVWPSVPGEDGGSRRRDLCAGRQSSDWPLVCESRRGDARRSGDLAVEPSVRGRSASVNSSRGDGGVVTRAGGASGPAEKCKQRGYEKF